MNFTEAFNKFFYDKAIIKRNRFQYQFVQVIDGHYNKNIILITAFLYDGKVEKFWQEYTDTVFTIDDIIATDWEIINA
jgi:hypothetical protein